jgi:hypothetical protein
MGAETAGYKCLVIRNYMIARRSVGRPSSISGSYPARGIRPCPAASRIFTVARTSTGSRNPKVVDLARPTAPPRPGPFRSAAKTFCSCTHSGRLTPLHASRAWAHGPFRGLSCILGWPPTPFVRAPGSVGHIAPGPTLRCSGRVTEAAQPRSCSRGGPSLPPSSARR